MVIGDPGSKTRERVEERRLARVGAPDQTQSEGRDGCLCHGSDGDSDGDSDGEEWSFAHSLTRLLSLLRRQSR